MTDKSLTLENDSTKYKKITFHLIPLEINIIGINTREVNYFPIKISIYFSILISAYIFSFTNPITDFLYFIL